jgi:Gram-negative bacterial TonB protein C-terminal
VLAGSATIVVYVDAHGRAVAADIVRATDESFEPAALQLLAGWHYRPAMCGTRPIEGRYTAIFNG